MFKINTGVPSPLQYNPESPPSKSLSYTMISRKEDKTDKWLRSVPGPGSYSTFDITSKEDTVPVSKFISSPSTRFGRLQRLT